MQVSGLLSMGGHPQGQPQQPQQPKPQMGLMQPQQPQTSPQDKRYQMMVVQNPTIETMIAVYRDMVEKQHPNAQKMAEVIQAVQQQPELMPQIIEKLKAGLA